MLPRLRCLVRAMEGEMLMQSYSFDVPVLAAVDCGAESGRVMAAAWDGERIDLQEMARFSNVYQEIGDRLCWDLPHLAAEIQQGVDRIAGAQSVGVCTWGVDLAFVDAAGDLLTPGICYRDTRHTDYPQASVLDADAAWEATGIQPMGFNSCFQLEWERNNRPELFDQAAALMTVPDWLHTQLGGSVGWERTNASTGGLLRGDGSWWQEGLEALRLPTRLFTPVRASGTMISAANAADKPQVIVPGCHDTASAVAALPCPAAGTAFISCGTWSLMGVIQPQLVTSAAARAAGLSNEHTWDGQIRLLKNIMGLWVLQRCRADVAAAGDAYDYDQVTVLARAATAAPTIDVDDQRFFPLQGKPFPERVADWCRENDQPVPADHGTLFRAVLNGLAASYAQTRRDLEAVTGTTIERIALLGGGSKSALLCELTAAATGLPVHAGPDEATALGNALVQAQALGWFTAEDLPRVAAASGAVRVYQPA